MTVLYINRHTCRNTSLRLCKAEINQEIKMQIDKHSYFVRSVLHVRTINVIVTQSNVDTLQLLLPLKMPRHDVHQIREILTF